MPKQVQDIKQFLELTRSKSAQHIVHKKDKKADKFKLRSSRYLYTFVVSDKEKASKLRQSLPPALVVKEL